MDSFKKVQELSKTADAVYADYMNSKATFSETMAAINNFNEYLDSVIKELKVKE